MSSSAHSAEHRPNKAIWAMALVVIFGLRIISYFTLFPNSIAMTQVVKVGLRLGLTMVAFVWMFRLRQRLPQYKISYSNMLPILLYLSYLGLGLLSLFWTSDLRFSLLQLFMITEAMVFAWFFYSLLIYYNADKEKPTSISQLFAYATLWIGLAFIVGLFVDPTTFYRQTHGGEVSRLGGYIINPNELGMLSVLGIAMVYIESWRRSRVTFLMVLVWIVSVAVLLLTQSRSSLGAFMLLSGLAILLSGNIKWIIASVAAAVLAIPVLIREIIVKQGDVEEVMSMTGRLPFWTDLIHDGFIHQPILGYGFMRIAKHDKFDSIHAYAASMTHNTFIQVLLNLGLVGAFIVLFQMIATSAAIRTTKNIYLKRLAIFMLIPLIINSLTEFGIFGESNYGVQFYQLLILFFVMKIEHRSHHKYDPFVTTSR